MHQMSWCKSATVKNLSCGFLLWSLTVKRHFHSRGSSANLLDHLCSAFLCTKKVTRAYYDCNQIPNVTKYVKWKFWNWLPLTPFGFKDEKTAWWVSIDIISPDINLVMCIWLQVSKLKCRLVWQGFSAYKSCDLFLILVFIFWGQFR